ncbi:condensation domain-containing protein, partial [Streptomyces sp. AK02-01A]|uniref:condensation domain-containing protein n=1 Tax=Streptomyces sp. AK02-01A TaxID=3028648 RepID=UPI0029A8C0CA
MSGPAAGGRRLNESQLGVWYAQRIDPLNPVFNMGGYLEIHGAADPGLLKAALTALVAEDETSRLRFTERDGVPWQSFGPAPDFTAELVDLSAEPDPDAEVRRRMRADMDTVPDLEHDRLFNHILFRLGPERHVWFNRVHHLIHDGYSATIMRRRAAELYTSLAGGEESGTAFGSFERLLDEQSAYAGSAAQRRDAAYWRRIMEGAEHPSGPSSAMPTHRVARRISHLGAEVFERLVRFGERAGVSWQQALITAAAIQRHLWTGDPEVLLSLPVSGRLTPASLSVPGMMANVLPLRCRIDRGESCEDLAARVAALTLRAQWHQRYDSADLLRDLDWPANSRQPFGPVVNIVAVEEQSSFAGMPAAGHMLSTGGTAEDLSLTVTRSADEGLRIDFTIDEAYQEAIGLSSYERAFHQVVDMMTVDAGVLVGDVDVLSPEERTLVMETWNNTHAPIDNRPLNEHFEEHAHTNPNATALIYENTHLTYHDLNNRANQLAHHLTTTGTQRGDMIAILLERGTDFATALLAVTKIGAAYALLDPDFPDQRLHLILQDSRATTVITNTNTHHRIPPTYTHL